MSALNDRRAKAKMPGRLDREDITLFKSAGTAIEDLAAASLLVNEAIRVRTRGLPKEDAL